MNCPHCGSADTEVKDSRPATGIPSIRRRRRCTSCRSRFSTYELIFLQSGDERCPELAPQVGQILSVHENGVMVQGHHTELRLDRALRMLDIAMRELNDARAESSDAAA